MCGHTRLTARTEIEVPDAMSDAGITIREASVADLGTIIRHRRCMFRDMGFGEEAALDAMEATSAPFIKTALVGVASRERRRAPSVPESGLHAHQRAAPGIGVALY
jgi:hypothetical protein